MVKLWIDNQEVNVEKGTTILNAAASVGIKIPTLCFLKDLNEIGACRVCIVEIKGKDALVAACNTARRHGDLYEQQTCHECKTYQCRTDLIPA